jgi:hypothetical protein
MSEDQARWESGRPVQTGPFKFESSEVIPIAPKPPVLTTKAHGKEQYRWESLRPINPATEWSEQPRTTAVAYQQHIRAVVGAGGARKKPAWALVELLPVGEEPGQTRPLVLAAAAFRLCWISMLAQARDVLRW